MLRIGILKDSALVVPPDYGPDDVMRALGAPDFLSTLITLDALSSVTRDNMDVVVLPYLSGELEGLPLEGLLRFHASGGGLVFLGDTPNCGRSFPFRNSLAPEFRLTKCRDTLTLTGLTDAGKRFLGDLPGLESMIGRTVACVRTSAYPPDECIILIGASAHLKDLGPVVLVERRHPRFLGARLAVVGFDGGEPRENTMGVCALPWTPDYGLLNRNWPGINTLVARLVAAVAPVDVGAALEFKPVTDAGQTVPVLMRIRNLSRKPLAITHTCSSIPAGLLSHGNTTNVPPRSSVVVDVGNFTSSLGPSTLTARVESTEVGADSSLSRTHFCGASPRPHCIGFSTYRAFRKSTMDEPYRDFVHQMAELGMQYIRMAFPWEDLEPEPGRYDWTIADQMLEAAEQAKLPAYVWIFPTARGSGLGDGGVPAWALREPAMDRHGKPGNFPCIWSPFYRTRYFSFLEAVTARYAADPRVARFVYDFGNSDFAYTYHYYGDRGDLFDYSPHEQKAFATWLESQTMPLDSLSQRWGKTFRHYHEIPVPYPEQTQAWLIYDAFRTWGVYHGIQQAIDIVRRIAPAKTPPDPPGHGLGSIADIQTYIHHAQGRHWQEVERHPRELTEAHNMGPVWGGEPWQVGGTWRDYDDALFQSVRLEADYFTIPGPDLGLWENDIGRAAMIRRTMADARRVSPEIAIMDHIAWHQFGSLAQIGTRLDQPVDLLSRTCRYDYSTYQLLVLPPHELLATEKGTISILPLDRGYYENMLAAVEKGLRVVVFPRTGLGDPENPFRRVCGLKDISYGTRQSMRVEYPESWGGGEGSGHAATVEGNETDIPLLRNRERNAIVLFRPRGKGGFVLCGYDNQTDSLDAGIRYDQPSPLATHTLARLIRHLGLDHGMLQTGQASCFKELLFSEPRDYLLLFSHQERPHPVEIRFKSRRTASTAMDLADGKVYSLAQEEPAGWHSIRMVMEPRRGYYLMLEDTANDHLRGESQDFQSTSKRSSKS